MRKIQRIVGYCVWMAFVKLHWTRGKVAMAALCWSGNLVAGFDFFGPGAEPSRAQIKHGFKNGI